MSKQTRTARSKKPKQEAMPLTGKGVEAVTIQDIEDAAEAYVIARDKRQDALKVEVEKKTALMAAMHKHVAELTPGENNVKSYRYGSRIVTLEPVDETVKVKSVKEAVSVDDE